MKQLSLSNHVAKFGKILSSYKRVHILILLSKHGDQTLGSLAEQISSQIYSTSQHIEKMTQLGLINKTHSGTYVKHNLSPKGIKLAEFILTLKNI